MSAEREELAVRLCRCRCKKCCELAEAFEAMREALRDALKQLDTSGPSIGWYKQREALALADKVSRP